MREGGKYKKGRSTFLKGMLRDEVEVNGDFKKKSIEGERRVRNEGKEKIGGIHLNRDLV